MEWKVKKTIDFERCIKGVSSKEILQKIKDNITRLKKNPDKGKRLRRPYSHLWEVYKGYKFRLYYEIHERRQIILLRGFGPKRFQKKFLRKGVF